MTHNTNKKPGTKLRTEGAEDDRRVRRTRRQLREALVSLILEKGWEAVSVLDVCAKADVGRSTFYVHFADKEDLLLSGFDDLHATLEGYRVESEQPFAFAEPLLAHANDNHDLFRAVAGRQSGREMEWRFRDVVTRLIDAELAAMKLSSTKRAETARFVAGGFVEMLMHWLEDPRGVRPEALAASFRLMALAAVRAFQGTAPAQEEHAVDGRGLVFVAEASCDAGGPSSARSFAPDADPKA